MSKKIRHIYYLCPDYNVPTGGIHKIYDHVEILNSMGYSAYVLHYNFGFQCDWFKHKAPCAYPVLFPQSFQNDDIISKNLKKSLKNVIPEWKKGMQLQTISKTRLPPISEDDVLVIPEILVHLYSAQKIDLPFVIFVQNSYYMFNYVKFPNNNFSAKKDLDPSFYHSQSLLGVMTVSEDNTKYIKFVYPHVTLVRIRNGINPSLFFFSHQKKNRIAFMPRKLVGDIHQVINIIKERNFLKDWEFYSINNVEESKVGEILRSSALFLSCIYHEGCPLPPAEAIACGCIVIGYHGQGGKEYFRSPYAYIIETGNIVSFVQEVERIARDYSENPQKYLNYMQEGSKNILQTYSPQFEKEDISNAWRIFEARLGNG